jgi:hypothetical protein
MRLELRSNPGERSLQIAQLGMAVAVHARDGAEQRLDPRQRFSQAVVVNGDDVGAQLRDADPAPVFALESLTIDAGRDQQHNNAVVLAELLRYG